MTGEVSVEAFSELDVMWEWLSPFDLRTGCGRNCSGGVEGFHFITAFYSDLAFL